MDSLGCNGQLLDVQFLQGQVTIFPDLILSTNIIFAFRDRFLWVKLMHKARKRMLGISQKWPWVVVARKLGFRTLQIHFGCWKCVASDVSLGCDCFWVRSNVGFRKRYTPKNSLRRNISFLGIPGDSNKFTCQSFRHALEAALVPADDDHVEARPSRPTA